MHHPDLALAEYAANRTDSDGLLDAGEDRGRLEHLESTDDGE
jgi:cytochrome c oxidase subunit 1